MDSTPPVREHRPDGRRRRRFLLSLGGLGTAGALLVLGAVMMSNANFSRNYTGEQLMGQRITFKAVDALTPEERKSECVVRNAGKMLTTGKQAECFANEYIALHIRQIGSGRTYAELGAAENELRARVAAAQASGDPALPGIQKELSDLTRQRDLVFKAETLRGILLTSFGFSELGEKGAQAGTATYGGAGLVGLLSVAGLLIATRTPKSEEARS